MIPLILSEFYFISLYIFTPNSQLTVVSNEDLLLVSDYT